MHLEQAIQENTAAVLALTEMLSKALSAPISIAAATQAAEPADQPEISKPKAKAGNGQTSGGTPSSAPAASTSAEEPAAAPPAAETTLPAGPDVTEVNAAVLKAVQTIGKEPTVAILQKHGGSKVPEIDASKHAELLADLNAATAHG